MIELSEKMLLDPTFWLYTLTVTTSGFGVALFLVNWARLRSATNVYMFVTGLLFGLFLKGSIELYSFILRETGHLELFLNVLHSWWWDTRLIFTVVPLLALVGKMSYRFFIKRNLMDG